MSSPRAVGAILLAAAGLALAACSSDGGSNAPSVTFTPAPSTAGPTSSPSSSATSSVSVSASSSSASPSGSATTSATSSSSSSSSSATATSGGGATTSTVRGVAPTAPAGSTPAAKVVKFADVPSPTGLAVRPGDDRIFVIGRGGQVIPVSPDGTDGDAVLDIQPLVRAGGEQGLLGLAFHPTKPLAYVDYTGTDGGNTHIAEFAVAADGTMDPDSRRELLEIDQPYANHNGGQLAFGPDGMLYIGMGDGGSGGDPERRALNAGQLLGKILRIDPTPSDGQPYTIPADNPFVGTSGARPEIWSVGVRNPWRFSFDPFTGDLWIADVGQNQWEEVDVAWADEGGGRGANFGWSAFEGTHPFNADQPTQGAVPPIFEYQHNDEGGCSISGGALYRGAALPSLDGWYVYGDYCLGNVRAREIVDRRAGREVILGTPGTISSVAAGPDGELYVTSVDDDALLKVVSA